MLEWRSYVVGTCHDMSPKAVLMRGVASADMPWHVTQRDTHAQMAAPLVHAFGDMPWHVPTTCGVSACCMGRGTSETCQPCVAPCTARSDVHGVKPPHPYKPRRGFAPRAHTFISIMDIAPLEGASKHMITCLIKQHWDMPWHVA